MDSIVLSVINVDHVSAMENDMDFYLKMKPRDCILYSNDGGKFKIHKEVLGQTKFMRDILKSLNENCSPVAGAMGISNVMAPKKGSPRLKCKHIQLYSISGIQVWVQLA